MGLARRPADRDRSGTVTAVPVTALRPYRDTDESAVVALWQACGLTRPWNPPSADIALLRGSGHGEILVATQAGDVTGSVMVGHDGHRGWIYYLAVAPTHRRDGLGGQLMRAAEAWLQRRGIRKVELMIRQSNTAVTEFYARLGYREEPVTVMSRWLDGTER
jgi:ribosomal protein S18 acetylase RimI-like enzyme